jgi:UDP-N-acetylglucosamine--N-acetylmuramyl-(pentapeptide) pyrophosphoryl-undecaprenol N-acetylglucosamine transferase
MADAIIAADLVVSRAGASTLAELSAVGRPAVLMPYPFGRDRHQTANANELVERNAAVLIPDRIDPSDNAARLGPVLEALMADRDRLENMADAARAMGRPDAADEVAKDVLTLVNRR